MCKCVSVFVCKDRECVCEREKERECVYSKEREKTSFEDRRKWRSQFSRKDAMRHPNCLFKRPVPFYGPSSKFDFPLIISNLNLTNFAFAKKRRNRHFLKSYIFLRKH